MTEVCQAHILDITDRIETIFILVGDVSRVYLPRDDKGIGLFAVDDMHFPVQVVHAHSRYEPL